MEWNDWDQVKDEAPAVEISSYDLEKIADWFCFSLVSEVCKEPEKNRDAEEYLKEDIYMVELL